MEEYDNFIPCKSPLCMICVSPITINPQQEDNDIPITKEVFLKGIDILSNNLSLEDGCRFGREEEWMREFGTEENFVGSVCCGKCGEVVRSLVELQDLIRKTEVKLRENVNLLELSVVNSEGSTEEVEYSIGACLRFREEVLKSYQNRNESKFLPSIPSSLSSLSVKRSQMKMKAKPLSVKLREEAKLRKQALISLPQIKLEKLTCNSSVSAVPILRNQECQNEIDGENAGNNHNHSHLLEENEIYVDNDKEIHPNRDQFSRGKKRGRPRIHPRAVLKPKRARGRPRIKERKPKGPRGRPRKDWSLELGFDLVQNQKTDEIENKLPAVEFADAEKCKKGNQSESEVEYLPDPVSYPETDSELEEEDKSKEKSCPLDKRDRRLTKLNDPYNGRRTCRKVDKLLNDNGPYYLKPILVISPGLLYFFNCKILMEQDRLLCKHPNCDFEVKFEYFTISTFYAFRGIRYHVKHEHRGNKKPEDANQNSYCCPYCDLNFERRFFLVQHIKTDHNDPSIKPYPSLCEICGRSLPHSELLDHIYSHKSIDERKVAKDLQSSSQFRPGKTKDPTLPLEFPCGKCEQVFKDYTCIRTHLLTHIPVELRRQWQCDMCPEKLSSLNVLRLHMRMVHFRDEQPMPFVCKICGQKFLHYHKEQYEDHVRIHTGELPFQCHQCGKGFRSKKLLRRHEVLHLDNQIPCEYCSNVYKNILYLRKHHRKHHPETVKKPKMNVNKVRPVELRPDFHGPKLMYPCEPCGKVYIYKSQLIPHLKHAHKMFYDKSSHYPNMLTLEDDVKVKNSRNCGPRSKSFTATPTSLVDDYQCSNSNQNQRHGLIGHFGTTRLK